MSLHQSRYRAPLNTGIITGSGKDQATLHSKPSTQEADCENEKYSLWRHRLVCRLKPASIPATRASPSGARASSTTSALRMVEYPAGYVADHWCTKGHILLVLEGELESIRPAGRPDFLLQPGMSYQVQGGNEEKRTVPAARTGAKLFIVE